MLYLSIAQWNALRIAFIVIFLGTSFFLLWQIRRLHSRRNEREEQKQQEAPKHKERPVHKKSAGPVFDLSRTPADQEHNFFLLNGGVLKSLKDLLEYLPLMPDDIFNHHVSKERNDFVNWAAAIFGYEELAEIMKGAKTRHELMYILKHHSSPSEQKQEPPVASELPEPAKTEEEEPAAAEPDASGDEAADEPAVISENDGEEKAEAASEPAAEAAESMIETSSETDADEAETPAEPEPIKDGGEDEETSGSGVQETLQDFGVVEEKKDDESPVSETQETLEEFEEKEEEKKD